MPNLDFDAARRERQRQREHDPLTFTLGGQTFHVRDDFGLADLWAEHPEPPKTIADGATTERAVLFLNLARSAASFLIPDDLDRWWGLFDPATAEIIKGEDLLDVVNGLNEEISGRPTSPSSDSSDSPPTVTGPTSSSPPDETTSET